MTTLLLVNTLSSHISFDVGHLTPKIEHIARVWPDWSDSGDLIACDPKNLGYVFVSF
jgi:hypothetical protein